MAEGIKARNRRGSIGTQYVARAKAEERRARAIRLMEERGLEDDFEGLEDLIDEWITSVD